MSYAYVRRATATKAQVGINRGGAKRNATVFAAEFGAKSATLNWPNQRRNNRAYYIGQNRMVRRTFPIWRGNKTTIVGRSGPGWIMMPVMRKRVPQIRDELEREINQLFRDSARRSGLSNVR